MSLILKRSMRWLGYGAVVVVALLVGAFGLLQTPMGQGWAAGILAGVMSGPDFSIVVRDLEGTVPFNMRARRIEIADDRGVWLTLDAMHLELAAGDLLARRVHIRQLTAREIQVARLPETGAPSQPVTISERLRLPQAPIAVAIDRLSIERLVLAPDILGERAEAAITGHAVVREDTTEVALDLRRIDGVPGNLALDLRQRGVDPVLALRLEASEPTGLLLGRLLNRSDRPPLLASLAGEGPLADWRGRFDASAGQLARLAGEVTLSAGPQTVATVTGTAAVAPLLPSGMAALTGDSMPFKTRLKIGDGGAIALDALSVDMLAGDLKADLAFAGPDRAISAHLRASLRDLAAASALVGQPMRGSAEFTATVSGTEDRPKLQIDLTGAAIGVGTSGADQAEARVTVGWNGDAWDLATRVEVAASGRLRGIAVPEGLPREVERDLEWSLAARAAPDASAVEVTELVVRGAGVDIAGSGKTSHFGQDLEGKLRLVVADLRPFTGIFGRPVEGAATLDANARQEPSGSIRADVDGSITGLKAGFPALDALAGGAIAIAGSAQRDPGGAFRLDRLSLAGSGLNVAAAGSFDPGTRQLAATLDADIRNLQPAGKALGTALSGQMTGQVAIVGPVEQPRVHARLEGREVSAGGAALDRVRLDATIADVLKPHAAISGDFHSGGLDGTLSLDIEHSAGALDIRRAQLKAAGGTIEAELRIDLATLLTRGTAKAAMPDIAPWSRLAGTPLAGRLDATAVLDARSGQSLNLTLNGDRLSFGAGGTRVAAGHVAVSGRLNDLFGMPFGAGRAALSGVNFASGGLSSAAVTLDSPRPGRFAFDAEAKGRVIDPLTMALDGTGEISSRGSVEIRVARLSGALGPDRFQLKRPLTLAMRGGDLALSDLALSAGSGQVSGNMARRGAALSADLAIRNLSIASAARVAGYRDVGGVLSGDLSLGGTLAAPQGRFAISGRELRFALPKQHRLPTLGLDLTGTWNGRELALNGRASGLKGDRLELNGTAPLVLSPSMALGVPPQGRLALRLQGAGEMANLADLLPLGEDRVAGRFALDAAVNGTPAAPAASGHLTIVDGRYENFATGAVLTKLRIEIAGDRDRLTLREFSASDAANGSLAAQGYVNIGGAAPSADVSLTLKGFRIVARDVAVLAASGTVAVAGPVASPKVVARLTADQGDLSIPDNLPPNVTRLPVVEINSRAPRRAAAAAEKPSQPAVPVALDIRIAVPGRIFVRGRGLDSEWRGQIGVTGTSDAPRVAGSLEVVRGTFDFLGKTFKVVRGNIGFDGATAIDPTLDIAAEISAADITAQVLVSGPASSPKVAITSTPVVPQDEILSRVLFNRAVGQITAAEGIQVAQAAATLAGGGPGVLDRLRGRLGLDRLVFGSAPGGMASSNLNPASGGNAAAGTAISGGKYVAEGVYVGATQGLTPQSSKVVVEIEVRPRVTVQGDFSQSGGSGIGLNYKYDY